MRAVALVACLAVVASCGGAKPKPTTPPPYGVPRTHGTYLVRRAAHKPVLTRTAPAMPKWPEDAVPDGARRVAYRSGTLDLWAWFAMPDQPAGPAPVLVYFHGGLALDRSEFERCRPYLRSGFAVLTPTLRGRNGNPGAFELNYGEVDDAAAAVAWIATQPGVDRARIFVFGHSMGGATAAMLALRPDVPVRLTGSSGSMYPPDTFRDWAGDPDAKELVRFDVNDGDEVELRLLHPFAEELVHDHVAYVGTREGAFYAEAKAIASRARGAHFDVEQIEGDHFSALDPALGRFLDRARR